ncbi:MAG: putative Ig domain-containing protein, partial [Kiloniellales bacterium]|nr:putative Ig domain-containing protein [Kiloniellales bacterium]
MTEQLVDIENIIGTYGDNTIVGDDGDNLLDGLSETDTIFGGGGDDVLKKYHGSGTFDGGAGTDRADFSDSTETWTVDLSAGTASYGTHSISLASIENVTGSWGINTITGDDGDNTLIAFDGADTIFGGAGDDRLFKEDGSGSLDGGAGSDILDLSLSNDGWAIDLVAGTATYSTNQIDLAGIEHVVGSWASNTITGDDGDNTLAGLTGSDTIYGGAGSDLIQKQSGSGSLDGGSGTDTLDFSISSDSWSVDLVAGTASMGAGTVQIAGFEHVTGSWGDNTITGDEGSNVLVGLNGADTINGGAGDDTLSGGDQNDVLNGGSGVDTALFAADLVDYSISYNAGTDNWTVEYLLGDGLGTDTLTGIEYANFDDARIRLNHSPQVDNGIADRSAATGFAFNMAIPLGAFTDKDAVDSLSYSVALSDGSALPSWLSFDGTILSGTPAPGDIATLTVRVTATDTARESVYTDFQLAVIDGSQVTTGTTGNDTITGTAGADIIVGDAGDDSIDGGDGADSLFGGAGNDTLTPDSQTDYLDGGPGIDTADYSYSGSDWSFDLAAGVATISTVTEQLVDIENIIGTYGDNTIVGDDGDNLLDGLSETDTIFGGGGDDILKKYHGSGTFDGGAGTDRADFSDSTENWTVDLSAGTASYGTHSISLTGIENVTGSWGINTITGDDGDNT